MLPQRGSLGLRWEDIDWQQERITIHSPKTEHHPNGELRIVPLFPELRPYLEQAWDQAETGTVHVITRYRDTNANLRTQLLRIIKRAGIEPWPKLFQNLRSSRETELAEQFPLHVVCAWMGNSRPVATKHYLQVTDAHFAKAVQNPVQQPAVTARDDSQAEASAQQKSPVLQHLALPCDIALERIVGRAGLEPATNRL